MEETPTTSRTWSPPITTSPANRDSI